MIYFPISPDKLKARRAELGITQDQLAELARISRATVFKIEGGRDYVYGVQEHVAEKVARALECPIESLTDGEPMRQTRPDLAGKRRTSA
jgi:DNA-binding XRE family transcriptional regulator